MSALDLTIDDYTADELFTEWTMLRQLKGKADASIRDVEQQWQVTTDPDAGARLWDRYSGLWRDYQVLSAWTDLFWVAYVFTTSGFQSEFLRDHPLGAPEIGEEVTTP